MSFIMQKIIFTLGFLLATTWCFAQGKMPSAAMVLQPVYAQAAKEGKQVLLIFHASWCGWCRKMDTSLLDKAVRPLIDAHYVTAHLTVYEAKDKKYLEHPGALDLLTKHGGADQGLPYWLVLNPEGHLLAGAQSQKDKNTGCPATEEEVAYFISVLKKTSSLNEDQLNVIRKRFRKNESPAKP